MVAEVSIDMNLLDYVACMRNMVMLSLGVAAGEIDPVGTLMSVNTDMDVVTTVQAGECLQFGVAVDGMDTVCTPMTVNTDIDVAVTV